MTRARRRGQSGVVPLMMRAKDSSGQCQRYKGKLIKPTPTTILFAKTKLFSQAFSPARMINTDPVTGMSAQPPGKAMS